MNEQKHPLAKYKEIFNQNSINLIAFDIKQKEWVDKIDVRIYQQIPSSKAEVELTFEIFNDKAVNPDTLFFLMLNALFTERYEMSLEDFEKIYPEVLI